jgi:hypothetical protein
MIFRLVLLPVAICPLFVSPVSAQDATPRAPAFAALTECRKLPDSERLNCYDRQVAALEDAERRRDVVIVDRAEVQRTRRSLFGLTLPSLKLFGNDRNEPEFQQIETTLSGASQSGGQWLFALSDGTRWIQSDSNQLARTPKAGQSIRIRKGAMGSYLANIAGQLAIRVRRLN